MGLNKWNAPVKSAKTFQKVAAFKATSLLYSDQSRRNRLTAEQGGQAFQKVTNGLFFPSWPKESLFSLTNVRHGQLQKQNQLCKEL